MRNLLSWRELIGRLVLVLLQLWGSATTLIVPYAPGDGSDRQTVLTFTQNSHTITMTQMATGIGFSEAPAATSQPISPLPTSPLAEVVNETAASPSQQRSGLTSFQVGGIVGGAVGLLLVVSAVAWLIFRRLRRLNHAVAAGKDASDMDDRERSKSSGPMRPMPYNLPKSNGDRTRYDPLMMPSASNSSRFTSVVGERYNSVSGLQATLRYGVPTVETCLTATRRNTILGVDEEYIGLPLQIRSSQGQPPERTVEQPPSFVPDETSGKSSTTTSLLPGPEPQQNMVASTPTAQEEYQAVLTPGYPMRRPPLDTTAQGDESIHEDCVSRAQGASQSTATSGELSDSEFDRTTLGSDSLSISAPSESAIIPLSLEVSKRRAVDTLMAEFGSMLNHHGWLSGVSVRAGAGFPSERSTHGGMPAASSSGGVSRSTKRNREDSNDYDSHDETGREGESKRPRQKAQSSDMVLRRFACPFFKHNPKKHLKLRSCGGPGWESTHRIKEHLYRNHKLPIHCNRCGLIMPSNADLITHQRQTVACLVQLVNLPEGIDDNQEKSLRKRLRGASEEDKWTEIYKIIFPDEDGDLIPSPYYDDDKYSQQDAVVLYERVQRRELLRVVRKRLEEEVLGITGPLEDALRTQFVGIFREAQIEVFRSYQETRKSKGMQHLSSDEKSQTSEEHYQPAMGQSQYPTMPSTRPPSRGIESGPILFQYSLANAEGFVSGLAMEDFVFDTASFELGLPDLEQQQKQHDTLNLGYPSDLGHLPFSGYMDI